MIYIFLTLAVLVGAFWLASAFGIQGGGIGISILFATVPGIGMALGLIWMARKVRLDAWLAAGLVILVALLAPTSMLPDYTLQETLPEPIATMATIFLVSMPVLATLAAAMLVQSGVKACLEWRNPTADVPGEGRPPRRTAVKPAAALALALLLIGKTLDNLYWLTIWDNTYDPLGYLWLVLPILAALIGGVVLSASLAGRLRLTGLGFVPIVPGLMVLASNFAQKVDFRQLTLTNAATVTRAIDAYHNRHGHYPQDLAELVPLYSLTLPGPVIINGQSWCYDGGDGYYRLGYIDRSHWSDPNLVGRLYRTAGSVPDQTLICSRQIETMQAK